MQRYPKPDLQKRDDCGGVYYFRYYHPIIKDGKKAYIRPNQSTGVKDKVQALRIATDLIKQAIDGGSAPYTIHTQAPPVVKDAEHKISEQAEKFVIRTMQFHSDSYKRCTRRSLRYLTVYIPSDLVSDINGDSIPNVIEGLRSDREKAERDPYEPKYWAELFNDWSRFLAWELRQEGTTLRKNYASPEDLPRPDKKKFTANKDIWDDEKEFKPFMERAKVTDPELYELALVVRYSSIDPADYFDMQPEHMAQKSDGLWYIVKGRAKEPGHFYDIPIDRDNLLELFLRKKAEAPSPTSRMFTWHSHKDHQRESWGAAISWRRKRLFESLFNKPGKTFKDLRRTFSDYWQRRGVPVQVVKHWMGHSESSTTIETNYSDWRLSGDMMKGAN
jgi:integrase